MYKIFQKSDSDRWPASVAECLTHSAAWRAQWPGFDSARARPPTKELYLIIPMHMINIEQVDNPAGRKKRVRRCPTVTVALDRYMVSALGSRVGWIPAHNERTNDGQICGNMSTFTKFMIKSQVCCFKTVYVKNSLCLIHLHRSTMSWTDMLTIRLASTRIGHDE